MSPVSLNRDYDKPRIERGVDGSVARIRPVRIVREATVTDAAFQGIVNDTASAGRGALDDLYASKSDLVLNVKDYGADPDAADNTAAIQAAIDAVTYSAALGSFTSRIDFAGSSYVCLGSLDATGIRQPGITLQNGGIYSKAAGKIALDFAGTNTPILTNFKVYGDATSAPAVGVYVGRAEIDGAYPACANARFVNVDVNGYYTKAAVVNFASEVSNMASCIFTNRSRSLTAYAYVNCGHAQTLVDYVGAVTSDYITLPTPATGSHSNILHHAQQGHYLRAPDVVLSATGITNANPAVVSVDPAALTTAAMTNGDQIYFYNVAGMTELNYRTFTIANLNEAAGTFELSGEDSTAHGAFTSGTVFNKTGPAVLLNGTHAMTWDAGYLLTYGNDAVRVDLNNGSDWRNCRLDFHAEHSNRVIMRLDRDTSVKVVPGMRINLLQSNQTISDQAVQLNGTGSVRFDGLEFSIAHLEVAPTNGLFAPVADFDFHAARIYTPREASFVPSSFAGFSGEVYAADNDRLTLNGMSRLGLVTNSTALTKPGIRWTSDSFFTYNETLAAERRIQLQDSATTAQFNAATDRINTRDKYVGKMAWNVSLGKPVWATGGATTSTWVDATGAVTNTPA